MTASNTRPENRILAYDEILSKPAGENGEKMVDVRMYDPTILAEYEQLDMIAYTGDVIFVRDSIAHKLADASLDLAHQNLRLRVVYGYRHPKVQILYFSKRRAILKESYPLASDDELDALTHNFTAMPKVAGHPTGGAIDCTLTTMKGAPIDMGTQIDFNDARIRTFSEGLSETQIKNRQILRDSLILQGFAPFNGEWWHFSYGDREWACFYNKPISLYSALDFNTTGVAG